MTPETGVAISALVVSVLSLGHSIFSGNRSAKLERKVLDLQERADRQGREIAESQLDGAITHLVARANDLAQLKPSHDGLRGALVWTPVEEQRLLDAASRVGRDAADFAALAVKHLSWVRGTVEAVARTSGTVRPHRVEPELWRHHITRVMDALWVLTGGDPSILDS